VEKLIFSLQVFFLGFSVVMVVLFSLYCLTLLFNAVTSAHAKRDTVKIPQSEKDRGLPPELAAAIAAALDYHGRGRGKGEQRTGADTATTPSPLMANSDVIENKNPSRWLQAARKERHESMIELEIARRKKH
jgi:Na+-transporting methylmalonyl-CoA/oxaloacetate decarboxylase gamma subunit